MWGKQLDRDNLSDITNGLICAVALLLLKHKKFKIVISGILPRNKAKNFRRKKLIETNKILKYKRYVVRYQTLCT